jgi:hypothetical protein
VLAVLVLVSAMLPITAAGSAGTGMVRFEVVDQITGEPLPARIRYGTNSAAWNGATNVGTTVELSTGVHDLIATLLFHGNE